MVPSKVIGVRPWQEVQQLRKVGGDRMIEGEMAYGRLHSIDTSALAGLTKTADWLLSYGPSPITNAYREGSPTSAEIRQEAALADHAARTGHRLGLAHCAQTWNVLRWTMGYSADVPPLGAVRDALPDDAAVGVRTAAEVWACVDTFRPASTFAEVGLWNQGAGRALLWALGELAIPPLIVTAPAGETRPVRWKLREEATAISREIDRLQPGDEDMADLWHGARAALAWLCGETQRQPERRPD